MAEEEPKGVQIFGLIVATIAMAIFVLNMAAKAGVINLDPPNINIEPEKAMLVGTIVGSLVFIVVAAIILRRKVPRKKMFTNLFIVLVGGLAGNIVLEIVDREATLLSHVMAYAFVLALIVIIMVFKYRKRSDISSSKEKAE